MFVCKWEWSHIMDVTCDFIEINRVLISLTSSRSDLNYLKVRRRGCNKTWVAFVLQQVRQRFRPCSTSPTSSLATPSTVTSPPSLVSSPVRIAFVFPLLFLCYRLLMTECSLCIFYDCKLIINGNLCIVTQDTFLEQEYPSRSSWNMPTNSQALLTQ